MWKIRSPAAASKAIRNAEVSLGFCVINHTILVGNDSATCDPSHMSPPVLYPNLGDIDVSGCRKCIVRTACYPFAAQFLPFSPWRRVAPRLYSAQERRYIAAGTQFQAEGPRPCYDNEIFTLLAYYLPAQPYPIISTMSHVTHGIPNCRLRA